MAHTPGPWGIGKTHGGKTTVTVPCGNGNKNIFIGNSYGQETENAGLMSIAPEMFSALSALLEELSSFEDIEHDQFGCEDKANCAMCRAKEVLARAEKLTE